MRASLYDFAGGEQALLSLTAAMHVRCLADPKLSHPFTHADANPEHVPRLAAGWAQVLDGPTSFTEPGMGGHGLVTSASCGA